MNGIEATKAILKLAKDMLNKNMDERDIEQNGTENDLISNEID